MFRALYLRVALIAVIISGLSGASFSPKITPAPLYGIRTVCIDAGHGGKDPGCHGSAYKEKEVSLAIALKLGKLIEQHLKDVKVVYTRKTDVFVELNDRAGIANKAKADLFICIHCNSACVRDKKTKKDICKQEVHGAETYVMGLHKTNANLDVAKRENAAILLEDDYKKKYDGFDPDSDEGYILMNLTQNAYLENSLSFAAKAQKQFKTLAGRHDKGVKQAGFLVLWKTAMPSVLIESGYLTNGVEHDFLGSEEGQTYMATSIFRALREYKDEIEGRQVTYNDEPEKMKAYIPVIKPDVKPDSVLKNPPVDTLVVKKDTVRPVEPAPQVKPNVIFKVQFHTSATKLPDDAPKLKGVKEWSGVEEKGIWKYMSGEFIKPEDAVKRQKELKDLGFKDAFLVAYKDGMKIPYGEAVKLIKD
ncbi:MAG: N-acetylmuramoyl-L-alanine amidase [Bacteroidia bacterium]|nr:N-acetylmuramoyl-L-alanine amidase [Bacteroidia bacterium]